MSEPNNRQTTIILPYLPSLLLYSLSLTPLRNFGELFNYTPPSTQGENNSLQKDLETMLARLNERLTARETYLDAPSDNTLSPREDNVARLQDAVARLELGLLLYLEASDQWRNDPTRLLTSYRERTGNWLADPNIAIEEQKAYEGDLIARSSGFTTDLIGQADPRVNMSPEYRRAAGLFTPKELQRAENMYWHRIGNLNAFSVPMPDFGIGLVRKNPRGEAEAFRQTALNSAESILTGAAITGALPASISRLPASLGTTWGNIGKGFVRHFVMPEIAAQAVELSAVNALGYSPFESTANWLKGKGWNPYLADFAAYSLNPGYMIGGGVTDNIVKRIAGPTFLTVSRLLAQNMERLLSSTFIRRATDEQVGLELNSIGSKYGKFLLGYTQPLYLLRNSLNSALKNNSTMRPVNDTFTYTYIPLVSKRVLNYSKIKPFVTPSVFYPHRELFDKYPSTIGRLTTNGLGIAAATDLVNNYDERPWWITVPELYLASRPLASHLYRSKIPWMLEAGRRLHVAVPKLSEVLSNLLTKMNGLKLYKLGLPYRNPLFIGNDGLWHNIQNLDLGLTPTDIILRGGRDQVFKDKYGRYFTYRSRHNIPFVDLNGSPIYIDSRREFGVPLEADINRSMGTRIDASSVQNTNLSSTPFSFYDFSKVFNSYFETIPSIPINTRYTREIRPSETRTIDFTKFTPENVKLFINKHPELGITLDGDIISVNGAVAFLLDPITGKFKSFTESLLPSSIPLETFDIAGNRLYLGEIKLNNGVLEFPPEYSDILRSNVDLVRNMLGVPDAKLFGSTAAITGARFPHNAHDIEFLVTPELFRIIQNNPLFKAAEQKSTGTYTLKIPIGNTGRTQEVDINIVDVDPRTGYAVGTRAEELFRLYYPDLYSDATRERGAGNPFVIPYTPLLLLDNVDPTTKTIMDSFSINPQGNKGKHLLRPFVHITYSDPIAVLNGLHQYGKSLLGENVRFFPMEATLLTDPVVNMLALRKLGINLLDSELEAIANDPMRMKNLLDYWFISDRSYNRYVLGTWPLQLGGEGRGIVRPEYFKRSAVSWFDSEQGMANGGNHRGEGLNVVFGGDSSYGFPAPSILRSLVQPLIDFENTNNLLSLIDEINFKLGGILNSEHRPLVEEIFSELGIPASKIYDNQLWLPGGPMPNSEGLLGIVSGNALMDIQDYIYDNNLRSLDTYNILGKLYDRGIYALASPKAPMESTPGSTYASLMYTINPHTANIGFTPITPNLMNISLNSRLTQRLSSEINTEIPEVLNPITLPYHPINPTNIFEIK